MGEPMVHYPISYERLNIFYPLDKGEPMVYYPILYGGAWKSIFTCILDGPMKDYLGRLGVHQYSIIPCHKEGLNIFSLMQYGRANERLSM